DDHWRPPDLRKLFRPRDDLDHLAFAMALVFAFHQDQLKAGARRPSSLHCAAAERTSAGSLAADASSTVTVPAVPSTSSIAPSAIRSVAPATATTQGMPSSRETITAWLMSAPTLTTTAPAP